MDPVPALASDAVQVLGGGRMHVAADRFSTQAHCLGDRGYPYSFAEQGVDQWP